MVCFVAIVLRFFTAKAGISFLQTQSMRIRSKSSSSASKSVQLNPLSTEEATSGSVRCIQPDLLRIALHLAGRL